MNTRVEQKLKEILHIIQEEKPYQDYVQAKKEIAEDQDAQTLLLAYQKLSYTLQIAAVNDAKASEKDISLFQTISMSVFEHDIVSKYVSNEMVLKSSISEIIQYLSEHLNIKY